MGNENLMKWGPNLYEKIVLLEKFCRSVHADDLILMVDAWDVIIQDTPANIVEALTNFKTKVLFGYELACAHNGTEDNDTCPLPDKQNSIHHGRYLCSGVLIGRAGDILQVIEKSGGIPYHNDQTTWARWYIENYPSIDLDLNQTIIANLCGSEDQTYFENGLVRVGANTPMVCHFNGYEPKHILKNIVGENAELFSRRSSTGVIAFYIVILAAINIATFFLCRVMLNM